jgi:hypothetical protein
MMISSKTHGILDYLVGVLLIIAPWLFGFANSGAETHIFVILGVAALIYSLLTDYEWGAIRLIPFSAHLAIDFMSGLLLSASPWLFGFADRISLPHVIFGLIEMGAVMMTRRTASVARA